jgi:hypothetical protein
MTETSVFGAEEPDDELIARLHDIATKNETIPRIREVAGRESPRQILITRVNLYWIKGVLERASPGERTIVPDASCRFPKLHGPNLATDDPYLEAVDIPKRAPYHEVCAEAFGRRRGLLIDGTPGSGKTFAMLEIVRARLALAQTDQSLGVPVVLDASSYLGASEERFTKGESSRFRKWIERQLVVRYQASRRQAHLMANSDTDLELFIDGILDLGTHEYESAQGIHEHLPLEARREEFLRQVSDLLARGRHPNICLCASTVTDDTSASDASFIKSIQHELTARPVLTPVLTIKRLEDRAVRDAVESSGTYNGLQWALIQNPTLWERAGIPFFLNTLLTTYRHSVVPDALFERDSRTLEKVVLNDYINTRLSTLIFRSGEREQIRNAHNVVPQGVAQTPETFHSYLRNLSEVIGVASRLFLIEVIQPNILNRRERFLFRLFSSLLYALFIFFAVFIPVVVGQSSEWYLLGKRNFPSAAGIGALTAFLSAFAAAVFSFVGYLTPMRSYMLGLFMSVAFAAGRGFMKGLSVNPDLRFEGWHTGLQTAGATFCASAIFLAWIFDSRVDRDRIVPIDNYGWEWRRGLIAGLLALSVFAPVFYFVNRVSAIGLAPSIALFVLLWGCFNGAYINSSKIRPNHGIIQSWKRAEYFILVSFLFALFVGFGYYIGARLFPDPQQNPIYVGLVNGALGLCFCSCSVVFGLIPAIQHLVLRTVLWRKRFFPWDLVRFLDLASEAFLLRKVGTGYMFIHESLRIHFLRQ